MNLADLNKLSATLAPFATAGTGDHKISLYVHGGHAWAETNGGPVGIEDEGAAATVRDAGLDFDAWEAAREATECAYSYRILDHMTGQEIEGETSGTHAELDRLVALCAEQEARVEDRDAAVECSVYLVVSDDQSTPIAKVDAKGWRYA